MHQQNAGPFAHDALKCIFLNVFDQNVFPIFQLAIFQHYFRLWLSVGHTTNQFTDRCMFHYSEIKMSTKTSEFTTVCSAVSSGWHQINIKVSHHWPFVKGIQRWALHSPHKGPVMQKVILLYFDPLASVTQKYIPTHFLCGCRISYVKI